jgi:hypothetical protein
MYEKIGSPPLREPGRLVLQCYCALLFSETEQKLKVIDEKHCLNFFVVSQKECRIFVVHESYNECIVSRTWQVCWLYCLNQRV